MRVVVRLPKRQVRLLVAASLVSVIGAGVAAQTPAPAEPTTAAAVLETAVPHDATGYQPAETVAEPTMAATVAPLPIDEVPSFANEQAQDPADVQEQGGEQETPPQGEQQEPPVQQLSQPPADPAQELLTPEEREALALVEQMISEQEGVLMGTGFSYAAAGRRDPFRSLLAELTAVSAPSVRPFGLPGFLINEVDLKAIAAVQGRWHAMVTGPNQRAYFLEVGTQLFDGHVVSITAGEVLFEQVIPDITGARRTRQVTKRLRTTDGGGETP